MKHPFAVFFLLSSLAELAPGQVPPANFAEPPQVVDRGAHHRVWRQVVADSLNGGTAVVRHRVQTVTEIANGLHFTRDGDSQWIESQERFEIFPGGEAIARNGPHQVIVAPNINSPNALDVLDSAGHRFQATILGIEVLDVATGRSELIAELKDSVGQLHGQNQIAFSDAFDGVRASVRFSYRKSGIEQDLLLEEFISLPPGFDPATSRLECWTEFTTAPVPERTPTVRDEMESEIITFGSMRLGAGRAFTIDDPDNTTFPVASQWLRLENRTFLVEAIRFASVETALRRLGGGGQAAARRPPGAMQAQADRNVRPFPAAIAAKNRPVKEAIQNASVPYRARALVIDFDLQNNYGSLTLKGDTTYYLSSPVIVTNLIAEGAAVLKFASNAVLEVAAGGTVDFQADRYRPIIFTAKDDHSVGAQVGSGGLANYYANPALRLHDGAPLLQHARFSYAREAINLDGGKITVRHGQFTFCQRAFAISASVPIHAENNLYYAISNVVYGRNFTYHGRNITVHQCAYLTGDTNLTGTVTLTNSLLVHMTNWGATPSITTNLVVKTTTSPFQEPPPETGGAGSFDGNTRLFAVKGELTSAGWADAGELSFHERPSRQSPTGSGQGE